VLIERAFDAKLNGRMSPAIYANRENPRDPFHFPTLRRKPGHHTRFAELKCDGVYTEKPFAELEPATLEKVYGKIGEWGERRRAMVVTGDSRSDTWDRLGLHDCYIKLGEPTIEAVRQALLADETRIAYSRPDIPTERIVEVRIKSTLTGDDPLIITFNPGFNSFIGGRGSGKSALIRSSPN
jgi:chromosome segregation protein